MKAYIDILKNIMANGRMKENRTGTDTKGITGAMFEHDMEEGFPLITTRKMFFRNILVELDFFINGRRDKQWLLDRNCPLWTPWCNPEKVPYDNSNPQIQAEMTAEMDLGRIYGVQWRNWNGVIDQLAKCVNMLRNDTLSRRNIVTAWNPSELGTMALPPCHYGFQVLSDGKYIDLAWNQRSCDTPVGVPSNIASYAALLMLLGSTTGLTPRKLIGFLMDVHIYEDQFEGVEEQISREPRDLPLLHIKEDDIFHWECEDYNLIDYSHHPKIKYPVAT
jgi:thymidylate synthase